MDLPRVTNLPQSGLLQNLQGDLCSPWSSLAAGLSSIGCPRAGGVSALAPGAAPALLLCPGGCRAAPLTPSHCSLCSVFLLAHITPEASLLSSAFPSTGSVLDLAGIGSMDVGEASTPVPKPCHANPMHLPIPLLNLLYSWSDQEL